MRERGTMDENSTKEAENDVQLRELRRLVNIAFWSIIPVTLTFVAAGILANSLTLVSVAVDYGLSFIVQLFAYQSMRAIQRSNVIKFPYGTGKLENFSGFLYGALAIPSSLYILYFSVVRMASPAQVISFNIVQIPMLLSLIRSVYLFRHVYRLKKQADGPMVEWYYVSFKIAAVFDIGILAAMSTAWALASSRHGAMAFYLDPAISLLLGFYMLYTGVKLTVGNFKILMDLPLPEEEQLKIMGVLAREFDNYENVGNIYTRRSGSQRFVDIELYLKDTTTVTETMRMQARMQKYLDGHFDHIKFTLLPLTQPGPGIPDAQERAGEP